MTTFPDRLQSPSTDSRTRSVSVPNLRSFSEHPTSDRPPQFDVPELKALALDHIRGGLEKCDIVEETFSRFASR